MTNTRVAHRAGRHLVLIDIENLVGNSSPTSSEVEAALQALSNAVPGFEASVWWRAAITRLVQFRSLLLDVVASGVLGPTAQISRCSRS